MRLNPFDNDVVEDLRSSPGEYGRVAMYAVPYEGVLSRLRALSGKEEEGMLAPGSEVILLSSDRAGFGKTHFLARLREAVAEDLVVVPLDYRREQLLDWDEMLASLLSFGDEVREGEALSLLQAGARRFFASGVAEMIERGEVPCGQRDEALRSLRENWRGLLDPSDREEAVARWFEDVFEALRPSLVEIFSRLFSVSHEQGVFWVAQLFRYHLDSGRGSEARTRALAGLLGEEAGDWRESSPEVQARSKFQTLAEVLGGGKPLVYVADHLDSFFNDREGGFDVASLLLDLAGMRGSGAVILSVNADLWASAFNGHLPSAFEDRLSGGRVMLGGIDVVEASAMVSERLGRAGIPDDMAARFNGLLGIRSYYERQGAEVLSPRKVLREARAVWDRFAASGFTGGEAGNLGMEEIVDMGALPEVGGDEVEDPLELPALDFLQFDDGGVGGTTPLVDPGDLGGEFIQMPEEELEESGEPDEGEGAGEGVEDRVGSGVHGFQQVLSRVRGRSVIRSGAAGAAVCEEEEAPAAQFNRLRAEAMAVGRINGELDLVKLRLVLERVGTRLPMLEQEEVSLEGVGASALAWRFDGDTVLFGFEVSTDYPYWQGVVEHGLSLRRSEEAGEEDDFFPPLVPAVKLVVFCPVHEPLEVASWKALHEVFAEGAGLIDCVELDRETVAGMYAAADMFAGAERGASGCSVDEVFALVARELDYLWARLTRPLRAGI
ncbi:MAG: hypothetical protein AAF591_16705 [Verrucomicrobiota bacterium]